MIDQNRDGFIDKEDLHDMLASLGKDPPDSYLDNMMKEAPGPINFTMFFTLFGEKLNGTDPEDVIKNAFACFDAEQTGFIKEDYLRELLMTMGDRYTFILCLKHQIDSPYDQHMLNFVYQICSFEVQNDTCLVSEYVGCLDLSYFQQDFVISTSDEMLSMVEFQIGKLVKIQFLLQFDLTKLMYPRMMLICYSYISSLDCVSRLINIVSPSIIQFSSGTAF